MKLCNIGLLIIYYAADNIRYINLCIRIYPDNVECINLSRRKTIKHDVNTIVNKRGALQPVNYASHVLYLYCNECYHFTNFLLAA